MRSALALSTRLGKLITAASVVLAAMAGATVVSTALAAPAMASPSGDLASATNAARAAAGLPGLAVNGQLSAVAQAWANHLAATGVLAHNPSLRSQVSGWTLLGENVGMAASIASVQQAFMNSPEHRANILDARYTQMGVGSATSTLASCNCQVLWVVVDFRRPVATATPAQPAPAQPAPARPAPARPAPATPAPKVTQHRVSTAVSTVAPAAAVAATPNRPAGMSPALGLTTQLAQGAAAGTAGDPVGRMLNFATVVSQLPVG